MSRKGKKTSRIAAFSGNSETIGTPLLDLGSSGQPPCRFKSCYPHKKRKVDGEAIDLSFFMRIETLKPELQGLRFAPVGAGQTSTGRFAPCYPHDSYKKCIAGCERLTRACSQTDASHSAYIRRQPWDKRTEGTLVCTLKERLMAKPLT